MMELTNGTPVVTIDEKQAGNLQRVVIHPETKVITHIVVEKGRLFKEEKVIDFGHIHSASADMINLRCTFKDIKEMSPLYIKQHVPVGMNDSRKENFDLYINYTENRNLVEVRSRTIQEDLIALKEGARVTSQDGDTVGTIKRILTAPKTGKVSQFIISNGLFSKTEKSIPIEWVKLMDDDEVWLSVPARKLDDLPLAEA